jgi:Tol biopolymer transport system component
VFARSTDDGHALTSSDIYLVTLSDKNLRPLRITAGVLARSPALSADASKLAYLTDAGVMLADLVH